MLKVFTCSFLLVLFTHDVMCNVLLDTSKSEPQNIYEVYKEILDSGDTVKIRNITSGYCIYEDLTQIIKKNDSTLIVNRITTPCLDGNKNNTSPATKLNKWKNRNNYKLPALEDFNYMPYSIEVPFTIQNFVYFNIQTATGRMRVINLRKNLSTQDIIKYTPFANYNLNYLDFIEFVTCDFSKKSETANDNYSLYNAIISDLGGNLTDVQIDLFGADYFHSYGTNPTFYINHLWGIYINENFIVLIENVQNGLTVNGIKEQDYTDVFIKMAESIKPIDPNVFDLNDLDNYKQ